MNWKIFFITFGSIFLAELGDKTQLATIAFTAENVRCKWIVFLAASGALILTSFLGVFCGHILTNFVSPKYIKISAGLLFIIIGLFMLMNVAREAPPQYAKLICEIQRVYQIEKCRSCTKFFDFAKDHVPDIDKIKLPKSHQIHKPYNCEECNTEMLKKLIPVGM